MLICLPSLWPVKYSLKPVVMVFITSRTDGFTILLSLEPRLSFVGGKESLVHMSAHASIFP